MTTIIIFGIFELESLLMEVKKGAKKEGRGLVYFVRITSIINKSVPDGGRVCQDQFPPFFRCIPPLCLPGEWVTEGTRRVTGVTHSNLISRCFYWFILKNI